ncbi:MAG: hypothetical protein ACOY0T_12300 [Myxococcota bacterium]
MSFERLFLCARVYLGVLLALCLLIFSYLHIDRRVPAPRMYIVSVWQGGQRTARIAVASHPEHQLADAASAAGASLVIEDVLDDGPVLSASPFLFGMSFVPGRDAIEARVRDKVAYATPDDLLKLGAYELFVPFGEFKVKFGVDPERAQTYLSSELGVSVEELRAEGRFRRLAVHRRVPGEPPTIWEVTPQNLRAAVIASGRYLARIVRPDGTFRYEINAATGEDTPEYNLPRHAGTTWYLAQAAGYSRHPAMRRAVRQAADYLTGDRWVDCGKHKCITEGDQADLGSSALALLALVELVETGISPELTPHVSELAAFLRSQQRPDGEFKHLYDRVNNQAIDVQFLYYSGEAAFALSRAHRVTSDPRDLDAASRALARLVEKPWWYIGWRYYWPAEHWTCHALDDLWDRAPDHKALRFCLDWQEFVRDTAIYGREAAPEYEAGATSGAFVPPQIIVSASRMEAAVATLAAAQTSNSNIPRDEVEKLEAGIRATLAFMMRFQFVPGPAHLMPDPATMHGAFPTSETDLRVRIDNPQHVGTGLLEYLRILNARR